MRVVILGSGRGSNAEAILLAQQAGRLGAPTSCARLRPPPPASCPGPRFGIPATYLDPAPFKTKLEGPAEQRYIQFIRDLHPDLVVLAGFMRVIKPAFLAAFRGKIINLHPSLLPSFPGLDAIGQAWRRGVKITGCTVHEVTAEVDGGPIVAQAPVRIESDDTLASLTEKIHVEEHRLLPEAIAQLSTRPTAH
jgi:phosphoribosylglycinamide formyltransferase-1